MMVDLEQEFYDIILRAIRARDDLPANFAVAKQVQIDSPELFIEGMVALAAAVSEDIIAGKWFLLGEHFVLPRMAIRKRYIVIEDRYLIRVGFDNHYRVIVDVSGIYES